MPDVSFLTDNLSLLAALAAAGSLVAALCALILVFRRSAASTVAGLGHRMLTLELGVQHLESAMRDELARLRVEAADRGDRLRDSVTGQVTTLGGSIDARIEDSRRTVDARLTSLMKEMSDNARQLQADVKQAVAGFGETLQGRIAELSNGLNERITGFTESQVRRQSDFQTSTSEALASVERRVAALIEANATRQDELRRTLEQRLDILRASNEAKLDQMRSTVDEKLQGTLEKRLGESFALVSDRLENVQRGLGEMQSLATGVGDLKRVLTNVKTRGGWAEVQLGAMLESMLAPHQYAANVVTRDGSLERVEYVLRLPGHDDTGEVLLPIDAKFPTEDYERLLEAQTRGDVEAVEIAARGVEVRIRLEAKKIREKYVNPPRTCDFALLYLPTEGLYAEVLRRGSLAADIQRDHRITVVGPTTLSAVLNSLQMGFKTLAIQKRSSEVWTVLGEAKTEFEKYGHVWDKLKKQLETAQNTVEEAGKRTRAVTRRLRDVASAEPISGIAPELAFSLANETDDDRPG